MQLLLRKLAILERYLLDCAASEFYKDGMYDLDFKNPASDKSQWLTGQQLADLYLSFVESYPIVSIEDGFDQDDWDSWVQFTQKFSKIQVLGDDLTVTNTKVSRKLFQVVLVMPFYLR